MEKKGGKGEVMRISESQYEQAIIRYNMFQSMIGDKEPNEKQMEKLNELLLIICLFEKQYSTIH